MAAAQATASARCVRTVPVMSSLVELYTTLLNVESPAPAALLRAAHGITDPSWRCQLARRTDLPADVAHALFTDLDVNVQFAALGNDALPGVAQARRDALATTPHARIVRLLTRDTTDAQLLTILVGRLGELRLPERDWVDHLARGVLTGPQQRAVLRHVAGFPDLSVFAADRLEEILADNRDLLTGLTAPLPANGYLRTAVLTHTDAAPADTEWVEITAALATPDIAAAGTELSGNWLAAFSNTDLAHAVLRHPHAPPSARSAAGTYLGTLQAALGRLQFSEGFDPGDVAEFRTVANACLTARTLLWTLLEHPGIDSNGRVAIAGALPSAAHTFTRLWSTITATEDRVGIISQHSWKALTALRDIDPAGATEVSVALLSDLLSEAADELPDPEVVALVDALPDEVFLDVPFAEISTTRLPERVKRWLLAQLTPMFADPARRAVFTAIAAQFPGSCRELFTTVTEIAAQPVAGDCAELGTADGVPA